MRWRFCLLMLLFLGSVGAIVYAAAQVQREADSVTVAHTLLAGDPAAAEGLVMQWHSGDDALRWDITDRPGTQHTNQSNFSCRGIWTRYGWDSPGQIIEFAPLPTWYSDERQSELTYHYLTSELQHESGYLARLVKDVATRMESGMLERSEHLRVADYYDSYPLYENGSYLLDSKGENVQAFQSYFSIPIPEDLWLDVIVRKEPYDDRLSAVFQTSFRDAAPTLRGIILEDQVYFYFPSVAGGLDFSQLEGGPGIYQAPYHQNKLPNIDASGLKCAYSMASPATQIEYLKLSQDLSFLFLATQEENARMFTILCRDNMETVAQAVLPEGAPLQAIYPVPGIVPKEEAEGYLVLFEDDSFCFFTADAAGTLLLKFRGSLAVEGSQTTKQHFSTAAYDGARLAVLGKDPATNALYLQIHDASGLSYAGRYDSSLYAFGYEDGEPSDQYDPRWEPRDVLSRNYQLIWQASAN